MLSEEITENQEINLGNLFRLVLMQSKSILLIVFSSIALWIVYFIYTPSTYNIDSLLSIEATTSIGQENLFSQNQSSLNLENQIILYDSRPNLKRLIEREQLQYSFKDQSKLDLVDIEYLSLKKSNLLREVKVKFQGDSYEIFVDDNLLPYSFELGKDYTNKDIKVKINKSSIKEGDIDLRYYPLEDFVSFLQKEIQVSGLNNTSYSFYNTGGLIRIRYVTDDPPKGIDIINSSIEIFIEEDIRIKSEKARRAVLYIEQSIEDLKETLNENKIKLRNFQQNNNSFDVDLEARTLLESLSVVKEKIASLQLQKEEISSSYTDTNPIYINLQSQEKILNDQLYELETEIKSLPTAQQKFIDLYTDVEVSQNLYTELLNQKMNFSISEASTLGNIRVVDSAYKASLVGPKLSGLIITLILASIVALIYSLIKGLYFLPISNPAEIADSGLSKLAIFGIFPYKEADNEDKSIEQAAETLILNLRQKGEESKIILITSPSASNGKSFVSRNTSIHLSELGFKTLLIDCDLKRGDQHKEFGKETVSKAFVNELIDDEGLMENLKVDKNLYFLPRIKNLRSSFQWVDSMVFNKLISKAKDEFDFIIIDSAPFLSVTETSLLMQYADISLLLVRHDVSKINEVKQSVQNSIQINSPFDGFIYNAYKKPSGYYGYYQYYGNYSYQYYADKYLYTSYDYENEK